MQDNKLIKSLVIESQLGNNSALGQLYKITIEQIYALTYGLPANHLMQKQLLKKRM